MKNLTRSQKRHQTSHSPHLQMHQSTTPSVTLEKSTQNATWDINKALQAMLKMPYYKNEAAASGAVLNCPRHEDAIAKVLKDVGGFSKWTPPHKLKKAQGEAWLVNPELAKEIPNGTFIDQPFGTHNSPDFIIKLNDKKLLFLECKSSTTTLQPTYNSGGVKSAYLYVFCSKKTNQTTIFKGSSVITLEQQRLIDEHIKEARQRDAILNEKLQLMDTNHRGISYYTRPMIQQLGGSDYTNYFTHQHRLAVEKVALDWVKEMSNK